MWPISGVSVPDEVPAKVRAAVRDAKLAQAVKANLASLMAARTAVIRIQRDQEVANLKELVSQGKLPPYLFEAANQPRVWANVAGHEDVDDDAFQPSDVEELLKYLDMVIEVLYVHPARLEQLKTRGQELRRE